MRLAIPHYARRRMEQRGVTEFDIIFVLSTPDTDRPSKDDPGRRVYTGRPSGRKVSVVVVEGSDPTIVVTTWVD